MNADGFLLSKVDKEDYWVYGIVFKVQNFQYYEDAYNEIKSKLETSEFINKLVEDKSLFDYLFNEDETYKFDRTYFNGAVNFVFKNADEDEVEYSLACDFIYMG